MFDEYKITVEGITRVDDPLDEFGTMLVHFRIIGDRSTFDMPVRVSRTLIPDDEWVGEAKVMLHRVFTDLSRQTAVWSRAEDDERTT